MSRGAGTELRRGDRVRHPKLGLGQVLDLQAGKARIFFVDEGIRNILLTRFPLTPLDPRPSHWRLDRMDIGASSQEGQKRSYRNAKQCIEYFLKEYPGGFHGDPYLQGERNYKDNARQEAVALLGRDGLDGLLDEKNYREACERARKSLTNVVGWRESDLLWKQVLGSSEKEHAFAVRLRELLYGADAERIRFERFVSLLDNLGVARWPASTYFPWILFPDREVLVKPNSVKAAAGAWWYDVGYSPHVTWDGYRRIRDFCRFVRDELADLEPRDFIDVQTFMWVATW